MSTDEIEAAHETQKRRQRYEQWMNRCIWGAMVALVVAMGAWVVLGVDTVLWAGALALPLGYVGYVAIEWHSSVTVRDERDRQIEYEAGRFALYVVGFVFVALTPTAVAADVTGTFEVPGELWGVVYAYVFLFIVIGIASWYVEHKHS